MKNLDAELEELACEEKRKMEVDSIDIDPKIDKDQAHAHVKVEENVNSERNANGRDNGISHDVNGAMNGNGNINAVGDDERDDKHEDAANNDIVAPSSDFELSEAETGFKENGAENSQNDDGEGDDCDTTQELDLCIDTSEEPEESSTNTTQEDDNEELPSAESSSGMREAEAEPQNQESEPPCNGVDVEDMDIDKFEHSIKKNEEGKEESVESERVAEDNETTDSCKVLISMFVKESSKEKEKKDVDISKDGSPVVNKDKEEDKHDDNEETVEGDKEPQSAKVQESESISNQVEKESQDHRNVISLEMAAADDDSASQTSDDEVDINDGLNKCFSALEREVFMEESKDESTDGGSNKPNISTSNVTNDNKADEFITEESPDHDKALEELENIEKKTKKILDEGDSPSSKRAPSIEKLSEEPETKKPKLDEEAKDLDHHKLKKVLKRMTRRDLEDMIQSKMIEILTNRSEIGDLRQKVDSYQKTVEKWQARAQALSKQCTDLGTVMKKYITDKKNRSSERIVPVKITRSVGLQVMTTEQRKLQQQKTAVSPAAGARIATIPSSQTPVTSSRVVKPVTSVRQTPVKLLVANNAVRQRAVNNRVVQPQQQQAAKLSPQQLAAVVRSAGQVSITNNKANNTTTNNTGKKNVIDVVDLSDEDEPKPLNPVRKTPAPVIPVQRRPAITRPVVSGGALIIRNGVKIPAQHPAPLPPTPPRTTKPGWKMIPGKPSLKINRRGNGIVLSWNLTHSVGIHAIISSYQLYAYQENQNQAPDPSLWKKVGDVKALPLPMACTLTQFTPGNKYHFAVRALDCHNRLGPFSDSQAIKLS